MPKPTEKSTSSNRDHALNTPSPSPAPRADNHPIVETTPATTTTTETNDNAEKLNNGKPFVGATDATGSTTRNPENNDTFSTVQHTIAQPAVITGTGLFLSDRVTCTICPAPPNHGIVFERVDLEETVRIPALVANVTDRARRTTLRVGSTTVETVEHCMSALAGLQIDNAVIQIDGPELPCGDGSAKLFTDAILKAGLTTQHAPRFCHRITEPITVQDGDATLVALPAEQPDFQILFDLDYDDHQFLRRQLHAFRLTQGCYTEQIAPARTFSLEAEAKALWERGMCTHLTPADVLVIGPDGPIDNVFRFDNEPARHKVLDVLGDLFLLGCPIQGRIVAYRSGHSLNHELVRRLRDQMDAQRRREMLTKRPAMDNRAIQKLLHHRYPMLMVDRVIEIEGDRRAIGIKNVTVNEPFFQGHYPGTPIMPGVLIVEAMAQMSGLLLSRVLEHTGRLPILLSLDKVKLRRQVVPGDTLVLEVETIRAQARNASVKCTAYVGDQIAAEARIKFLMVDAENE